MDALRLVDLTVGPYALDLVRPFGAPGHPVTSRAGLIVRLTAEDGTEGFGEMAPLPGLHDESLAEVHAWLVAFAPTLVGVEFRRLWNTMLTKQAPRIAMWGLESAHTGLLAHRRGEVPATRFPRALRDHVVERVGVNALFDGDEAHLERELERLAPYPAVKVKVGRRPLDTDRAVLARIVEALPDTRLRLDANRLLDLDQAVALVAGVPCARIEYAEDPVANADDLARFRDATGVDVAIDRPLEGETPADLDAVSVLVVKPTLLTGVIETFLTAQRATRLGKRVVVSSALESGLGLSFLAQLAAAVQEDGVAAGIGTDALLAGDIIEPRFDTSSGFVRVADWNGRPSEHFIETTEWETLGTTT